MQEVQTRMDEKMAQILNESHHKVSQVESLLKNEQQKYQQMQDEKAQMAACVQEQKQQLLRAQQQAEQEREQLTQAHRAEATNVLLQSQQQAREEVTARDLQNQALLAQQTRLQEAIHMLEQQRAREVEQLHERTASFQ